jgi:DNA-binding NtrC family response regulator
MKRESLEGKQELGRRVDPRQRQVIAKGALALILEEDLSTVQELQDSLRDLEVQFVVSSSMDAGLQICERNRPSVVFLSDALPGASGLENLCRILEMEPGANVVMLNRQDVGAEEQAEERRLGALECLGKPLERKSLEDLAQLWMFERAQAEERARRGRRSGQETVLRHDMVGSGDRMAELFDRIDQIAPHYRVALISGETGTGKELIAHALHASSPVADGPFVTCNCAAITDSIFESEMFGYVKGAFTGAMQDRPGLVAAASGGTLFLDEVGELPLQGQAKLLRVLQSREIRPVGSARAIPVDVRLIAATNRDLRAMVREKTFREDLYYRLAIIELAAPPLRERRQDIPDLCQFFLAKYAREYDKESFELHPRALSMLIAHDWPGNVRELENVIASAALLSERGLISAKHLRISDAPEDYGDTDQGFPTLDELSRKHAKQVLEAFRGNRVKTAEALGISRATLYRLLSGKNGSTSNASGGARAYNKGGKSPEF